MKNSYLKGLLVSITSAVLCWPLSEMRQNVNIIYQYKFFTIFSSLVSAMVWVITLVPNSNCSYRQLSNDTSTFFYQTTNFSETYLPSHYVNERPTCCSTYVRMYIIRIVQVIITFYIHSEKKNERTMQ